MSTEFSSLTYAESGHSTVGAAATAVVVPAGQPEEGMIGFWSARRSHYKMKLLSSVRGVVKQTSLTSHVVVGRSQVRYNGEL